MAARVVLRFDPGDVLEVEISAAIELALLQATTGPRQSQANRIDWSLVSLQRWRNARARARRYREEQDFAHVAGA